MVLFQVKVVIRCACFRYLLLRFVSEVMLLFSCYGIKHQVTYFKRKNIFDVVWDLRFSSEREDSVCLD